MIKRLLGLKPLIGGMNSGQIASLLDQPSPLGQVKLNNSFKLKL